MSRRHFWCFMTAAVGLAVTTTEIVWGQETADGPIPVTLERAALVLRGPERYQFPMQLKPIRSVQVAAPADGIVSDIAVQLGAKVNAQSEIVRLRSEERLLEQKIAEAALEAAKLEAGESSSNSAAAARVVMAQRTLELAEWRVNQMVLRAPLDGMVTELLVTPGEYVRVGQPLMRVIDTRKLTVDVPIERGSANDGDTVQVMVEDRRISGTVQSILPASERLTPLRELFLSVATAHVVLDNASGQLHAGQAVYSPMIPRQPVAEIPVTSVKNTGDEQERKVQVIRDGFVRDVPIQLLGQVGETHVFVSARFAQGDELILSSSREVKEGSWIRPVLQQDLPAAPAGGTPSRPAQPRPGGQF